MNQNNDALNQTLNISNLPINESFDLPKMGTWPASVHRFDQQCANAVGAALSAQRPLLVRGEPGMGKSQLARAVAHKLGRAFVSHVVSARSEAEELLFHFDTVARLGEAQALGAANLSSDEVKKELDPKRYLSPGPLWWAFDWGSAETQFELCAHKQRRPEKPMIKGGNEEWQPAQGVVLLIDEIDKADADLPNGLLETLGNGAFTVPWIDQAVGLNVPPLVIITTNEERELPGAFVRRCLVLKLALPEEEEAFVAAMACLGEAHFPKRFDEADGVLEEAARQVWADRTHANELGVTPPGQAEYLDMLRAVSDITDKTGRAASDVLSIVAQYALKKFG